MFEKLLASLIILAMLVLIMFLAFERSPPNGGDSAGIEREAPAPSPGANGRQATLPEVTPPAVTPPKPEAARQDAPAANGKPVVPDPGTPPPPPEDRAKVERQKGQRDVTEAPKDKPAKIQGRLREQTESRQQSVRKAARQKELAERETSITRRPASYRTDAADGDDETGGFIRRTQYRGHWDRNHYYECEGGECACSCDRPYWTQGGPCRD